MKHEKYFDVYDIGVKDGGSLFIWQKLLPNAKIIGT